ncbi:DUF305 domain-containing protein [Gloeothece verrucosa]|uniref:DUF305 domain-containing protein n=1 Tax=Gloeothece verrucosa (strain PCC 7822) TaxID=497965 RepID=E0ULC9_GLOV7|nr:DUF305 domain-containing protein [Gloeothece verrucosa]ADN17759.1 protein of unknown function DUF305 [Gloeothece verrucosa PCC 7822]
MPKRSFLNIAIGLTLITSSAVVVACSSNINQTEQNTTKPSLAAQNSGMSEQRGMSDMDISEHSSMNLGPADSNYDLRFIDAMKLHHQGAVTMAKEALSKSKRPEIKNLASEIIKAQNQEINEMKQWKKAWYPNASNTPMAYHSQAGHMMPMSTEQMNGMMMNIDLGAADKEFDLRFINAMISHHEGAISMASDAKNKSKHPEIKQLSENIIISQKKEIDQMKQWKKAWYNQ